LEVLREAVPRTRRVAILSNPANPAQPFVVKGLKSAGQSLSTQLLFLEARGRDEFERAFATVSSERADAMIIMADSMLTMHRAELATLALKNRMPSACAAREFVDAGGLVSYGPSTSAAWRRAAVFVDKILKGARPGELPVEQPTKFELVINAKTAKALGLTIPSSLLTRADQVLE
jgi:putative ABC transport system substrate-binding protein